MTWEKPTCLHICEFLVTLPASVFVVCCICACVRACQPTALELRWCSVLEIQFSPCLPVLCVCVCPCTASFIFQTRWVIGGEFHFITGLPSDLEWHLQVFPQPYNIPNDTAEDSNYSWCMCHSETPNMLKHVKKVKMFFILKLRLIHTHNKPKN